MITKTSHKPTHVPPQRQKKESHGEQHRMQPEPEVIRPGYKGSGKLKDKVAIITGGDSGIGRSIAVHFAREGADVVVVYHENHQDANKTSALVKKEGRECLLIHGDVGDKQFAVHIVQQTIDRFGRLNILVNNAAEQHTSKSIEELDLETMEQTFRTNIFSMFYLVKQAIRHMHKGDSIINTTSVTAYGGNQELLDYSSTKGAITAFTRSLGKNLASRGVRVNGVAPGPIWTPLIPSTFTEEKIENFGKDTPLGRPGQPSEVAPAFVFLASEDASYITSQVIHPNGGEIVNA
jgi:NAD(P)-dependent dehydrogenase (short-subunit alcohol dehydrogenase family)